MKETFEALFATRGKTLVSVRLSSCMGGNQAGTYRITRRTTHKRGYWARSITLGPAEGGKANELFRVRIIESKRDGSIRAATGDMGATLHSLEAAG